MVQTMLDSMRGPMRAPDEPTAGRPTDARRAASVQFRADGVGGDDAGAMLDPANQSLADALGVMMRLLQVGMIALGVLYVMSGLQSVREYERGLRLVFGSVQARDLEPGFQWSPPFPIGELVKVDRGAKEIALDKSFWVYVPEGTVDASPEKLAPASSLKPDQGGSGSVITGDGNIAHTQWKVTYHRDDTVSYARNILPTQEDAVVRAALMRGVVQACAAVTIDELLAKSTKDGRSIALVAKNIAQATLDRLKAGVALDQVSLANAIPPTLLRSDFDAAQAAVARLGTAREEALRDASQMLGQAAGAIAPQLAGQQSPVRIKGLIPEYEEALAKGDAAGAEQVLARLDRVLLGEPIDADGQKLMASGQVTSAIRDAQAYRNEVVGKGRADLARFEAKLAQFNANPSLTLQREWADAVRTFYARETTEVMLAPVGTELMTLQLNRDQFAVQAADASRKKSQADDAQRNREEKLKQTQFKTDPIQQMPG